MTPLEISMNKKIKRLLVSVLASSISFAGFMHTAQAGMISTEQVAVSEGLRTAADARAHVMATLERADVAAALAERGVDIDQARARVAALTDAEAARVAQEIDSAPAGANDILGTIVFIFVLLLITDILGFTKIFPFTRSIR